MCGLYLCAACTFVWPVLVCGLYLSVALFVWGCTCVWPVFVCGYECWIMSHGTVRKLGAVGFLRRILREWWKDKKTNTEVLTTVVVTGYKNHKKKM